MQEIPGRGVRKYCSRLAKSKSESHQYINETSLNQSHSHLLTKLLTQFSTLSKGHPYDVLMKSLSSQHESIGFCLIVELFDQAYKIVKYLVNPGRLLKRFVKVSMRKLRHEGPHLKFKGSKII